MLDMAKRVAKEAMCAAAPPLVMSRAPTLLPSTPAWLPRRVKATGTELEKKIAEACSNKPWGASSTMLAELAQHTYD